MTDEQKALREEVATICGGNYIAADAAIAVVLEKAAQVADANALEAWDFGADETRGLMRLQAADIAAAIRALIPASSDAIS